MAQKQIPKYVITESILRIFPSTDVNFVRNVYDLKNVLVPFSSIGVPRIYDAEKALFLPIYVPPSIIQKVLNH